MPELIPVVPEVLVWARRSGLASVGEAAERTGREIATILDWEAGRARPTYSQLERLADEYGVSVNALLLPEAPDTPEPPPDFRAPSGGHEPISRIGRRELRRARHLQSLLGEAHVLPPPALPAFSSAEDPAAVRLALDVPIERQLAWRDANQALREWRGALNLLGIVVLQYGLPDEALQGLSLPASNGGPPVILLNQSDWINARVFTLMHELGHLALGGLGGICDPWRHGARPRAASPSVEARCNQLAGAILVPADHLREQPEAKQVAAEPNDAVAITLLRSLANRYKVSHQVIWYRIREAGLVSDARFHALWPQLRPPGRKKRPPVEDGERFGVPRWRMATSRFGPQLVDGLLGAVDRGVLETGQVMRALNLGTGDLARLQAGMDAS